MSDNMPGLRLQSAIIREDSDGFFSLNVENLRHEFSRKMDEAREVGAEDSMPGQIDIPTLEEHIVRFIDRGLPLDVVLTIVLSHAGLDYWPTKPHIETVDNPTLLKSLSESRVATGSDTHNADGFITINRHPSIGSRPAVESRQALTPRGNSVQQAEASAGSGKKPKTARLRPHEEWPEHENGVEGAPVRFNWNIAFWLEALIGDGSSTNYERWEDLATGLSIFRERSGELKPGEEQRCAAERIPLELYRSLRARLFIGFACTYEHNLRGSKLNQDSRLHPACRPHLSSKFKPSNMGISQAQLQGYGVDVTKISKVYRICDDLEYLPPKADIPKVSAGRLYTVNPAIEKIFPSERRAALYRLLENWYINSRIPNHLRFVIGDPEQETPFTSLMPEL